MTPILAGKVELDNAQDLRLYLVMHDLHQGLDSLAFQYIMNNQKEGDIVRNSSGEEYYSSRHRD